MSSASRLLDHCRAREDWLLATIETLVQLESPSHDKPAVDRCGLELAHRLSALGGHVTRIAATPAGDHIRAEFGAGARQLLLLGHFDTVWSVGQLQRMPLRRDGDRLCGPGVFDMKAGIALGMLATSALNEVSRPGEMRIVMLWTSDEEVGSRTSRSLIETEAQMSEAVLVLEPALPGGALKTRRKGVGEYELTVRGVPAHAGVDPARGVSAVRELARQVLAVETLQDLERGVSVNVGTVSGGSRPNVIAEQAGASIDVRVATSADAIRLDAALRALTPHLAGARLEISGGFERPPMERTAGVAHLMAMARAAAAELGMPLSEGDTGGASDGNFCAALGVPTLDGLGAVGDGAHALHEHVVISALAGRAALIGALMQRVIADATS